MKNNKIPLTISSTILVTNSIHFQYKLLMWVRKYSLKRIGKDKGSFCGGGIQLPFDGLEIGPPPLLGVWALESWKFLHLLWNDGKGGEVSEYEGKVNSFMLGLAF